MSHGNTIYERAPPTDHRIRMGKRVVFFTFGYRFGPLVTDGHGQPTKWQPATENSAFWPPFEAWLKEHMKTNPPPVERASISGSDQWDRRP